MSIEENQEILTEGALAGAIVGFIHALLAGAIIAPLMTGSFFYSYGVGIIGAMISEIIKDVILGGIMGAIGAYVALRR